MYLLESWYNYTLCSEKRFEPHGLQETLAKWGNRLRCSIKTDAWFIQKDCSFCLPGKPDYTVPNIA